jgi:hypothetical protein
MVISVNKNREFAQNKKMRIFHSSNTRRKFPGVAAVAADTAGTNNKKRFQNTCNIGIYLLE